jgi:hypothetical protein
MDEEISKLTGWTTRKDYPTQVGISLPIRNWVGEDYHEIQFWEEATEPFVFEHPAAELYDWLVSRLRGRAEHGSLPLGMPETFTALSVKAYRNGKEGLILFELLDGLAGNMTDMPVQVQIEYSYGYARLGIGEVYTLRMLAQEFWVLTHNDWSLYPAPSHTRLVDGTICHKTTNSGDSFHNSQSRDVMDPPPLKIQEDAGRGRRSTRQLTKRDCPSIGHGPDKVLRWELPFRLTLTPPSIGWISHWPIA